MFFDFGAGELFGLAVIAVILVGPERLPHVAVDAAKIIKKVRGLAQRATSELRENLGPGFENLSPSDLHPKKFIKKQLASAMDEVDAIDKKPAFKPVMDPDLQ